MTRAEFAFVSEAARTADSSADTIRRAFDRGDIVGLRMPNGVRLIDRASLEAFAQHRRDGRKRGCRS